MVTWQHTLLLWYMFALFPTVFVSTLHYFFVTEDESTASVAIILKIFDVTIILNWGEIDFCTLKSNLLLIVDVAYHAKSDKIDIKELTYCFYTIWELYSLAVECIIYFKMACCFATDTGIIPLSFSHTLHPKHWWW